MHIYWMMIMKSKKLKEQNKCVTKRRLMFENYRDSLFNNKIVITRSQFRFKSDHYNVYTEEINKIVLNSSDNKRLQTFDGITTYPYDGNAFKVCENGMMIKLKDFKICDSEMMIKQKDIPIKLYYDKK